MNRIDDFNRACAVLFSALYDSFPIPIEVSPESVGFVTRGELENEPLMIFSETMRFLAEEEYIQYERSSDDSYQKRSVRLTAKGLARLQKVPEGIQPRARSLIDQLKDASSSIGNKVSSTAATEATTQVLRLVFGG